jgi:gamma-glutamyltranspeptidase/glutathione hydrolase
MSRLIDKTGMAVAITVSNGEGNGAIVPGCGFMLNNMLGEDDLLRRWTGLLAARSTARLHDGADAGGDDPAAACWALGSGGSNRIRSAMAQVLLRWGVHGQPLEDAIRAPRLHVEAGHLDVEPGLIPNPCNAPLKITGCGTSLDVLRRHAWRGAAGECRWPRLAGRRGR